MVTIFVYLNLFVYIATAQRMDDFNLSNFPVHITYTIQLKLGPLRPEKYGPFITLLILPMIVRRLY